MRLDSRAVNLASTSLISELCQREVMCLITAATMAMAANWVAAQPSLPTMTLSTIFCERIGTVTESTIPASESAMARKNFRR